MASAARSTIKEIMSEKTPETGMVNVELLCDSKRITDIIMYIDFVQIEAVIDRYFKSMKIVVLFC